jgi:hypothetical protein
MAKKKAKAKFDDDIVSNQIIGKYGDIVETGSKVLEDLQNFKTIGISLAKKYFILIQKVDSLKKTLLELRVWTLNKSKLFRLQTINQLYLLRHF